MMRAIVLALFTLFATAALAETGPEKLSDPAQEARAVELQKEFRCPVCQGQSLDESNSMVAGDLRRLIRARIEAGDNNDQIKQYLVARYGDVILMKPVLEPENYALWFGPLIILLIGGAVVARVVSKARRGTAA
ncbi:MAG TPA: cytochrome c-type biogenesis protein [Rhizomicrobium sp.]|jgi:cytochrome c-type biogenesis protein CcmH